MVGGNADARGASFDHTQNRREDSADRGKLPSIGIPGGWQRVVVPEQLDVPSTR
jgi:hypothetical protein